MKKAVHLIILIFFISVSSYKNVQAQEIPPRFPWPDGKEAAISLSFDDGRYSQVDTGTKFLNQHNVKVTFYVVPSAPIS